MSPAKAPLGGAMGAFALIGILVSWATCSSGCGATALDRSTTAATVAKVAIDATAGGIEVVCSEASLNEAPERLTACERAIDSHEAMRAAWAVWAAALVVAHSEEDEGAIAIALALAAPVFGLYESVADLLRSLGVDVPALPWAEDGEPS